MSRRIKKQQPNIGLYMQCDDDEISEAQAALSSKKLKEYADYEKKMNYFVDNLGGEIIDKGEDCLLLRITSSITKPWPSQPLPPLTSIAPTKSHFTQVLARSPAASNTYMVVDSPLGVMVSQVKGSEPPPLTPVPPPLTPVPPPLLPKPTRTRSGGVAMPLTPAPTVTTRTRGRGRPSKHVEPVIEITPQPPPPPPPLTRARGSDKGKVNVAVPVTSKPPSIKIISTKTQQPAPQQPVPSSSLQIIYGAKVTTPTRGRNSQAKLLPKPCEASAVGGLTVGQATSSNWKLNKDEGKNVADSKEITFNKLSGKTFPSLVVVARPHLRQRFIPHNNAVTERSSLDGKVKSVLMYTPSKFTEWLIQQGLLRSEQLCSVHGSAGRLKLCMYTEASKFPHSGGYVWISDCCPAQFVSVYSGSLFEGAPYNPSTLLKLIYHWACQTNVQNVVQWVKVDNLYVKTFFTIMRAVCTQAIHEKYQIMGGPRKKVEVGVISLGTTSQDGNMRQVKVEVLGVMDVETKMVRLRAVEPDDCHYTKRFLKILEPLQDWVHKETTILTDFTVDKRTLVQMGFHTIYQVAMSETPNKLSNQNVMDYLRRIVPRMFQNTLSLLSRQIIQQFLDELVWREMWGPLASKAYTNIISHISEQTKLNVTESFLERANRVSANPFRLWKYSSWLRDSQMNGPALQSTSATVIPTTPWRVGRPRKRKLAAVSETPPPPAPVQFHVPKKAYKGAKEKQFKIKEKEKEKVKDKEKEKDEKKSDKKEKIATPIPDEVMNFLSQRGVVSLPAFYYGSKKGDPVATAKTTNFHGWCGVCNKKFFDNIMLMKHMILHCQVNPTVNVDLKRAHQCNNCLRGFNTNNALQVHLDDFHFRNQDDKELELACLICEKQFIDHFQLVYHMHGSHTQVEMPYECGLCCFRSSTYRLYVSHFTEVHKGSEYIFCPHCLKVFSMAGGKKRSVYYISHLERHNRTLLARDCHRCQLSFIHRGILEQHLEADHVSMKDEPGVSSFASAPSDIKMPEPGSVIKLTPYKPARSIKNKNLYQAAKLNLDLGGVEDNLSCVECENSLFDTDHYAFAFNCLKCRYATSCEQSMQEHGTIFHQNKPQFTMGNPTALKEEMYCPCGYFSLFGNKIAKHLALCEQNTAYTQEAAISRGIIRVKKLEKEKLQQKMKETGESHNVLNMLGLMRKSPEPVPDAVSLKSEAQPMEVETTGGDGGQDEQENQMDLDNNAETGTEKEVLNVQPVDDICKGEAPDA